MRVGPGGRQLPTSSYSGRRAGCVSGARDLEQVKGLERCNTRVALGGQDLCLKANPNPPYGEQCSGLPDCCAEGAAGPQYRSGKRRLESLAVAEARDLGSKFRCGPWPVCSCALRVMGEVPGSPRRRCSPGEQVDASLACGCRAAGAGLGAGTAQGSRVPIKMLGDEASSRQTRMLPLKAEQGYWAAGAPRKDPGELCFGQSLGPTGTDWPVGTHCLRAISLHTEGGASDWGWQAAGWRGVRVRVCVCARALGTWVPRIFRSKEKYDPPWDQYWARTGFRGLRGHCGWFVGENGPVGILHSSLAVGRALGPCQRRRDSHSMAAGSPQSR